MVNLVLNYLCRPAGKGFDPGLKLLVLPLYLDAFEAPDFPRSGEGQAALLRFVCSGLLDNNGIEHDRVFTLVVKGYDAFVDAYHVRRHTDTAVLMSNQRIQQIARRAEVLRRRGLGLLRKKGFIPAYLANHCTLSLNGFLYCISPQKNVQVPQLLKHFFA